MWNNDKLTKNKNQGFTLIEILVAMGIFMIVFALGADFITTGFRATTFQAEQETAVQDARRAMDIMTKEIRGANQSAQGSYPIANMDTDMLEFYSDVEYDEAMDKVKYFLDGTALKKVVTQPGPFSDYDQPGATTTIAQYVNNQSEPIFTYYDGNYAITDAINNVRLVKITLKINVTPERAPNDYYVETDVHLRNLKSNL
jgi:prepilin-type N-terminal cleavage/methylation domain-containing protein